MCTNVFCRALSMPGRPCWPVRRLLRRLLHVHDGCHSCFPHTTTWSWGCAPTASRSDKHSSPWVCHYQACTCRSAPLHWRQDGPANKGRSQLTSAHVAARLRQSGGVESCGERVFGRTSHWLTQARMPEDVKQSSPVHLNCDSKPSNHQSWMRHLSSQRAPQARCIRQSEKHLTSAGK